ncbi:MAG: ATP-binding cassette domain-containing protein, partial [Acidimicrobiaceae bacterium]|nr:ATP-binding cassette domain-containing protein [Acidimicrobiaceae bacterium]
MLEISDLCAGYGGVPALRSIDFRVGPREHVAILGPNGAGKTTLLKTIS